MKRKVWLRSKPADKLHEDEMRIAFGEFCEDFYQNKKRLVIELNRRKIIRHKMIAIIKECEKRKDSTLFNNLPPMEWFEQEFYRKMSEEYLSILMEEGRISSFYKEISICSFKKDILEEGGV